MHKAISQSVRGRFIWPAIKLLLFCIVAIFVVQRAVQIWKTAPIERVEFHAIWLIAASLAYLIGWLPSVWFWIALLKRTGQPIRFGVAVRAYYVGQLGKYVPGKALVLVIRGAMVKDSGVDPVLAGLMAAYETLVFMAAGATLGIASAPWAFGDAYWSRIPSWLRGFSEHRALYVTAVLTAVFATTPMTAWLFRKMGRRASTTTANPREQVSSISAALVSQGVVATSFGWIFHALSLGFVLQSFSSGTFDLSRFPLWLAATTCSTVGGFVVLIAPGGLGVREGLLIETLQGQPEIGAATAVVAAGLLRAVWFATEVVSAAILYVMHRRPRQPARTCDV